MNSPTIEGTGHKLAHSKHRLCLLQWGQEKARRPGPAEACRPHEDSPDPPPLREPEVPRGPDLPVLAGVLPGQASLEGKLSGRPKPNPRNSGHLRSSSQHRVQR